MRASLPAIGAATTKRSRARVLPSASIVTRNEPETTCAVSTFAGAGRSAMPISATAPIATSARMIRFRVFVISLPRLQHFDQIKPPQPPTDQQSRKERGANRDDESQREGLAAQHERQSDQLGMRHAHDQKTKTEAERVTERNGD